MQISVSGQKIKIGAALQNYVKENVNKTVTKYFEHAINTDVVFSKESHKHAELYKAEILIHEGTGLIDIIKGDAKADSTYTAFEKALAKVEKQLRGYKEQIKNHRKPEAKYSYLDTSAIQKATKKKKASPNKDALSDNSGDEDAPIIIAEQGSKPEKLSVSEAVTKMDLAHLPLLLFIDRNTNKPNVVYHRSDGHISWVYTK